MHWSRRKFLETVGAVGSHLAIRSLRPWGWAWPQDRPAPGPADWPRYGHDLHNTRFNHSEKTVGRGNVHRLKLKWSFETAGPIQTCPTLIGDTLYFGSSDSYQWGLDARTGQVKWKFYAGVLRDDERGRSLPDQGVRSSSQFVEGRLYFGTGMAKVHCLDAASGREIWQTQVDPDPVGNRTQIFCSVAVFKGKVFVGTSSRRGQLVCLDAEKGTVLWRFDTIPGTEFAAGGSIWTSPAVDEELNLVFNGTGGPKSFTPPGPQLYSECIIANDIDTGELIWYDQARPADPFDLDYSCHPMVFDAIGPKGDLRRCVGAGNKGGFITVNRHTGQRYWNVMLTNRSSGGGPRVNSTAVAYNRVYVVSNAIGPRSNMSVTAALNAYTGEIEWWVPNGAINRAPVAVANGVFYQGLMDGTLEALDADTGKPLWQHKFSSPHRGGIALANGGLYIGTGATEGPDRYAMHAFTLDGS